MATMAIRECVIARNCRVVNKGGVQEVGDSLIRLTDADEAILLISTSTDTLDKNYRETVDALLSDAAKPVTLH